MLRWAKALFLKPRSINAHSGRLKMYLFLNTKVFLLYFHDNHFKMKKKISSFMVSAVSWSYENKYIYLQISTKLLEA